MMESKLTFVQQCEVADRQGGRHWGRTSSEREMQLASNPIVFEAWRGSVPCWKTGDVNTAVP